MRGGTVKGNRSGDYRFEDASGTIRSADLYQPSTSKVPSIMLQIVKKSAQAEIVVVEFPGASTALGATEADALANALFSTPNHSIERLIVVKGDKIILDRRK